MYLAKTASMEFDNTLDLPTAPARVIEGRSRVWQCATCGKLTGTHEPSPKPTTCERCVRGAFLWVEDRRKANR
jgi:hypothetical protein